VLLGALTGRDGIGDEELGPVQHIDAIAVLGHKLHPARTPGVVRLSDRHGQHLPAFRDGRQNRLPLRLAAGFENGEGAEHGGTEERTGQRTAPQLFIEHGRVGERAAGAAIFSGAQLYSSLGQRLGAQLGERATRGDIAGYAAYGLAYGACSLGCTLPVFLTVLGSALVAGGPVGAAGEFLLYGLGMGAVLSALTVVVALLKRVGFSRLRRPGGHLQTAAAVLLLATGAYVVYYWLTLGGILSRVGAPA